MLMTGLTAMIVGMGIVFSFLIVLVFAINIMVKCVAVVDRFCPVVEEQPKAAKKSSASDDSAIALAVALAASQKQID